MLPCGLWFTQVIGAEADFSRSANKSSQTLDQHIGVRIPGGQPNQINHLLVDGFPGVPQRSEPGLIRVGGAGAEDANAVIDEGRMHVGTTTRGMWQVTQSFLAMGQGLPGWS